MYLTGTLVMVSGQTKVKMG